MDVSQDKETLTIHDIARELGVSASTVSRAISGKGRIGEETRQRVLQYINEKSFYPNAAARSLAQSRTYNIAIVMPEVKDLVDVPFFHTCMHGAEEVASANDYDVLIITSDWSNLKPLERMVNNRKCDGIILTRTYENDPFVEYLKTTGIPFVVIGDCTDKEVVCVDHDNIGACKELVTLLFSKGINHIAYLGGGMDQRVNMSRYNGYLAAFDQTGKNVDKSLIFTDLTTKSQISKTVDVLLRQNVECIVCQDDFICDSVVRRLRDREVEIPGKIKVASCHYSRLLDNYPITITSLKFDTMDIGRKAAQLLLDLVSGENVPGRTLLDYEISLKESTK